MANENWNLLGLKLYDRRIELSYTRENIFELTHISVENVKMIEDGLLEKIPEIYLIDFLKRYSRILSISEKEILKLYSSDLNYDYTNSKNTRKRRKFKFKPFTTANFVLLPVLFTIMILQFIRIKEIINIDTPIITNEGQSEVEIHTSEEIFILEPGKQRVFSEEDLIKVINPSESRIVVKYNNKFWDVSLKEFEVHISDGQIR